MARRLFDMIDIVEVLQHWYSGRSKTDVAQSLGIDRGTVRKYVTPAETAGMVPGGGPVSRAEWAALAAVWFPELVDAKARSLTFGEIDGHRDRIVAMLVTNRPATVWQRLRDGHGLMAGLTSFRRYVWLEFPHEITVDDATVLRPDVEAGSEGQIDYGYLGMWPDPVTGRTRKLNAFVMVLAMSRHMFVRPVLSMDQAAWIDAHVAAFDFFGGAPQRWVPDNLKTGTVKADLYDPKLNRGYSELAEHYGCLIDPARASKPKDKPRVERPMSYIRESFYRGRQWQSLGEMQTDAVLWCSDVAGVRSHRGLGGAQPVMVFNAVEHEALTPLPRMVFQAASWSRPKVGADCHVNVAGVLYSVPWKHIGVHVEARLTDRFMEVFIGPDLVKTHARLARGRQTDWADYPEQKAAFFMRTPVWCRKRADELGADVAELIDELMSVNALHRLRACQGVIGLADKYDTVRLNAACRRAIDVGDPTYRTVKGVLIAGTETDTTTSPVATPVVPAHLHGPTRLFVVVDEDNDTTDDDCDNEQHNDADDDAADRGVDGDVIDLPVTVEIEVAS
jgi:transposase